MYHIAPTSKYIGTTIQVIIQTFFFSDHYYDILNVSVILHILHMVVQN